jgi:hypothetical protein
MLFCSNYFYLSAVVRLHDPHLAPAVIPTAFFPAHNSDALIVSKAKENGARAANGLPIIVRSKEHFRYPEGPGLLMLDHDKARATCELPRCLNQTAYLLPYKRVPFYYIKRRPFDI